MKTMDNILEHKRHSHKPVRSVKRFGEKYVRTEGGALIPVLRGGMVEAALKELGAQLIDVEPGLPFGVN